MSIGGAVQTLEIQTDAGNIQRVIRWGPDEREPVWYLRCPGCERRAQIDADQFHGRVSVQCEPPCSFHETFNFSLAVDFALGRLLDEIHADRGESGDREGGQ